MTVSTFANNNMTNLRRLFTLVLGLRALSPMRISAQSAAPSTPVESTSTSTYRVVPAIGPKLNIDEGWSKQKFPAHAMCYQSPERIAEVYSRTPRVRRAVVSAEKPADGSLRIVGTGNSYTVPAYNTLPFIARESLSRNRLEGCAEQPSRRCERRESERHRG